MSPPMVQSEAPNTFDVTQAKGEHCVDDQPLPAAIEQEVLGPAEGADAAVVTEGAVEKSGRTP